MLIRGATLHSRETRALLRDTDISPATDVCPHVAEYFVLPQFTAPSAAHLTICFLLASQLRELSVRASIAFTPASTVYLGVLYPEYPTLSRKRFGSLAHLSHPLISCKSVKIPHRFRFVCIYPLISYFSISFTLTELLSLDIIYLTIRLNVK